MATVRPRVRVPKTAKKGEIVTIKTLISHVMETGRRKGKDGKVIPRKIINKFTASLDGQLVFQADIHPAVSANPYISFPLKAEKSGKLDFEWHEDGGAIYKKSANLKVA